MSKSRNVNTGKVTCDECGATVFKSVECTTQTFITENICLTCADKLDIGYKKK